MAPQSLRPRHPHAHTLADVATHAACAQPPAQVAGLQVRGITASSQEVRQGDLFVALPGAHTHGARFAGAAKAAGAATVLTDLQGGAQVNGLLPVLVTPDPRAILGELSAWFYAHPLGDMLTGAITGTNGKTTTAYLLREVWRRHGLRGAVLGTVGVSLEGLEAPGVLTTPEAPELHALAAVLVEQGAAALAMEVSSHALTTHRVSGARFDVAGFTNLTQDHLDFHADMRDYFEAKALLFTPDHSRSAVVCVDDRWGAELAARANVPTWGFSAHGNAAHYRCEVREGGMVHLSIPDGVVDFQVGLPGEFNAVNAAMAVSMAHVAGMTGAQLAEVLGAGPLRPRVPGRMELIEHPGPGPVVLVDFAHNPKALEAALRAARAQAAASSPVGRVHVVFGATGERDKAKRPMMGAVAGDLADVVWLTDDDPHGEDRAGIRDQVRSGIRPGAQVREIAERREAIHAAILEARVGDIVLLAGRGHETVQEVGGVDVMLDDAVEARAALSNWNEGKVSPW